LHGSGERCGMTPFVSTTAGNQDVIEPLIGVHEKVNCSKAPIEARPFPNDSIQNVLMHGVNHAKRGNKRRKQEHCSIAETCVSTLAIFSQIA
jgi:hypothetical protein